MTPAFEDSVEKCFEQIDCSHYHTFIWVVISTKFFTVSCIFQIFLISFESRNPLAFLSADWIPRGDDVPHSTMREREREKTIISVVFLITWNWVLRTSLVPDLWTEFVYDFGKDCCIFFFFFWVRKIAGVKLVTWCLDWEEKLSSLNGFASEWSEWNCLQTWVLRN